VIVARFYMRLEAIRGRGYPVAGPPNSDLQNVAAETFLRSYEAAQVLEARGWWPCERRALHQALKELIQGPAPDT
jgi:hypothetical protein